MATLTRLVERVDPSVVPQVVVLYKMIHLLVNQLCRYSEGAVFGVKALVLKSVEQTHKLEMGGRCNSDSVCKNKCDWTLCIVVITAWVMRGQVGLGNSPPSQAENV